MVVLLWLFSFEPWVMSLEDVEKRVGMIMMTISGSGGGGDGVMMIVVKSQKGGNKDLGRSP